MLIISFFTRYYITVDKHWEPLHSRGAVEEERSEVWGIHNGGVWAAASWGAPTVPPLQSTCHLQPTKPTIINFKILFDPIISKYSMIYIVFQM